MIYIYDILLNFNNTRIYEFYEWDKSDDIIHIKKVPLYKVNNKTLDDFYNYNVKIEEKILLSIFNRTEVFKNKKNETLNYTMLLTDGIRVIAMTFSKDGLTTSRSRLLLDEEDEIIEVSNRINQTSIEYKRINKNNNFLFITRKEERVKKYLIDDLISTYEEKNYSKLKYLYNEYFGKESDNIDDMYQELSKALLSDDTNKNNNLYDLMKLANQNNNAKI